MLALLRTALHWKTPHTLLQSITVIPARVEYMTIAYRFASAVLREPHAEDAIRRATHEAHKEVGDVDAHVATDFDVEGNALFLKEVAGDLRGGARFYKNERSETLTRAVIFSCPTVRVLSAQIHMIRGVPDEKHK